jgi:ATP-binding cassette subfamily C protein
MSANERVTFFVFISFRAIVALLDLLGILAIGLLATSMALLITQGADPNRVIEVGSLSIPAITVQSLPILSAIILILFTAKAVLSILLTRQLANFLARIEARAAKVIAQNAFGTGIEGARVNSREEILFAVQVGSPSAFTNILNSVGSLTAEGFLFLLVLFTFALVNPAVALGAVIYFGLIGFVIQFFLGKMMQSTGSKLAESTVQANSLLSDLGEVLREATILGRQNYFYEGIFQSRLKTSGNAATQFVLTGMPRYIVETALIIAIAVFILQQALSGDISSSAATIGIFLSGGLRLTSSLLPLQSAMLVIKQAIPGANTALDLLVPNLNHAKDGESAVPQQDLSEPLAVSLKDVSFAYKNSEGEALSKISLEIPEGSQVAIIGVSGAGKSTIADLILGLLSPTKGSVTINGINPTQLFQAQPGLLGYVPQKPGMVRGTISQNIALAVPDDEIDEQRLRKAVADAHLSEFIESLPNGLDTDLGKRKDELSGGQLQRIGLARALYSQPKLLVMDEATSALDADSENEINKALDSMRGKVTVVLIAHRLNTIQRSNIVFLIESGRLSASGTFPELVKENDTVKNLANLMAIDAVNNSNSVTP